MMALAILAIAAVVMVIHSAGLGWLIWIAIAVGWWFIIDLYR